MPARADARKAVLAGTALWLLAIVLSLVFWPRLEAAGFSWWLSCSVFGAALGLIGLGVVQWRRR